MEKDEEARLRQLAARESVEAANCEVTDADAHLTPEEKALAKIPSKLLNKVLSKERQRQMFFAGVFAMSNSPETASNSHQNPAAIANDHIASSSWMDLVSCPPVPESMFAYAKSIQESCASAAQQSVQWLNLNETENQPQFNPRPDSVTPLMAALRRRNASSASSPPPRAAASASNPSSPLHSPKSPQSRFRSMKGFTQPPPLHLRAVSQQETPSFTAEQAAQPPVPSDSAAPATEIPLEKPKQDIAHEPFSRHLQTGKSKLTSVGELAADAVAWSSGQNISRAFSQPTFTSEGSARHIEKDIMNVQSSWRPLTTQQQAATSDFWESVESMSSTNAQQIDSSGANNVRVIGRIRRSNSVLTTQHLAGAPLVQQSKTFEQKQPPESSTSESHVKTNIAKHRKLLGVIKEQAQQWAFEANINVSFDIMDENGNNKCTFRELVLWIRHNYHELNRLPVLLHAFEDTVGHPMTPDSFVSKSQFSALLSAILHTSRAWVLFDSLVGDAHAVKSEDVVLSHESFVKGVQQLCSSLSKSSIEEHWSNLYMHSADDHGVSFKRFCIWLKGCDDSLQQQLLKSCTESNGKDSHAESSAVYSIVKPHILSLKDSIDESSSLNLEHFNLGPQEMSAWAPVFLSTSVSEMRLSYNRIGAASISHFLPAFSGQPLGGVGNGVVKL
jgi:hypothetical protein